MTIDTEQWERERLMEALESYTQGLADAPYVRKWIDKTGPTLHEGSNSLTFVISTEEVDRHGDVVSVDGWRLDAYRQNPVFLWAHNYTRPAIGRALGVWKEGNSLHAKIEFAPTEFAQEVASLYQGGFQRGVSVGFRPLQYEIRRDAQTGNVLGIIFTEQELLEISAAPVPANPSALRKALNAAPRLQGYYGELDSGGGPSWKFWPLCGAPGNRRIFRIKKATVLKVKRNERRPAESGRAKASDA